MYSRLRTLPQRIFFFGPRGTGKSVWLQQVLGDAPLRIDLLKSGEYLRYKRDPGLLAREAASLEDRNAWIIIDDVQKLPELLDEVHALLFESDHDYRFALSGSSARKLRRSHANMLAGRALTRAARPLFRISIPGFRAGQEFTAGIAANDISRVQQVMVILPVFIEELQ